VSFYTDVIRKDMRFHAMNAVRDINLLEPVFRRAVRSIMDDAAAEGTRLTILETYRSQELQEVYFERGATQLKTVGVHHYGLACDLGIVVAGSVNWKANYAVLGRLAAKYGLVWGGDWGTPDRPHSFRDYDHLQRIAVADQSKLFAGTWYPDDKYRPASVG
jgi:hypothetical protein